MKRTLFFLLLFTCSSSLFAQSWLWAKLLKPINHGASDMPPDHTAAVDSLGNVYVIGDYDTSSAKYMYGILLTKLDKAGNVLWGARLYESKYGIGGAFSVAVDGNGNAYITGYFSDTLTAGAHNFTALHNVWNIFIAKYSSTGTLLWTSQTTQVDNHSYGVAQSIASDNLGNTYITGWFEDTLIFGTDTLKEPLYGEGVFLAKYDPAGNVQWVKQTNIPTVYSYANGTSVALDGKGNVYITGNFNDTVLFNNDTIMTYCKTYGIFVAGYTTGGNLQWVTQALQPTYSCWAEANSIAVDGAGGIYVTGYFRDSIVFGAYELKQAGYWGDMFLAKYNSSGNNVWAEQAYALDGELWMGYSVACDTLKKGGGYLAMSAPEFGYKVSFGGTTMSIGTSSHGNSATIILHFDSAGNTTCNSIFSEGDEDDGDGVAVTHDGNTVYLAGDIINTTILGPDTLVASDTDAVFIARWRPCCPADSISSMVISPKCYSQTGSALVTVTGDISGLSYAWLPKGGTSDSASGLGAGSYTVNITDGLGCAYTASVLITQPAPPTLAGADTVCAGTGTILSTSGGGTYLWSNGATTSSITVSPAVTTTYSVTVVSDSGCKDSLTSTVMVKPKPAAGISGGAPLCPGDSAILIATGGGQYLWSNGSSASGITVSPVLTTMYSVVVSVNGCSDTASVKEIVYPSPTSTVCCFAEIVSGQNVKLLAVGGTAYSWNPTNGLSCTDCPDPTASPTQSITYTVTVTDSNGCIAQDTVTIDVNCGSVFLPDAFSPNKDGQNDILYVRGPCIKTMDFIIYDRWGNKVFESQSESEGWDGTYKGQPMNTGTYVYYLTGTLQDGTVLNKKGNVSLVR